MFVVGLMIIIEVMIIELLKKDVLVMLDMGMGGMGGMM